LGEVLDVGCGRGEFLELMREAGANARGIDSSEEQIAICREKGLNAETADIFAYLAGLPEGSLDGIFCAQVVEHFPPDRIPEFVRLAASRLARNGLLAIETPNPECLAIFATHFYLDPTHTRPVPSPLLRFYMEEFGLGDIEILHLSPAAETMPSLETLPAEFREAFFGGLDYAILGRSCYPPVFQQVPTPEQGSIAGFEPRTQRPANAASSIRVIASGLGERMSREVGAHVEKARSAPAILKSLYITFYHESLALSRLTVSLSLAADFRTVQAARLIIGRPLPPRSDRQPAGRGRGSGLAYANDMLVVAIQPLALPPQQPGLICRNCQQCRLQPLRWIRNGARFAR
jgi:SAM-dependent methyltransferase